jgi:hypothetical protein
VLTCIVATLLCADISNIRCTLECPSIKLGLQSNGGYNNDPITTAAMMLAAQEPHLQWLPCEAQHYRCGDADDEQARKEADRSTMTDDGGINPPDIAPAALGASNQIGQAIQPACPNAHVL